MNLILVTFALFIITAASGFAEPAYFAPNTFSTNADNNDFVVNWYTKHYQCLQEQPICDKLTNGTLHIYRFVSLRTFHQPFSVSIEISTNGNGTVTAKMCSGAGGYDPGKLINQKTRALAQDEIDKFLQLIESESFWSLPTLEDSLGLDGSQWIIEGLKSGKYHLVDRWTPKPFTPIGKIGRYMLEISGLTIEELY